MAKLSIQAGLTSQSVLLFVQDKTQTDGRGLGAIAPAGGSLLSGTTAYYSFAGANATATSLGTLTPLAAVNSAWSGGSTPGIVTLDDTHMLGWIRLDLPDAVLAAAKGRSVGVHLYGGTNMAPCPLEIELTGWDNQKTITGPIPNFCTINMPYGAAGKIWVPIKKRLQGGGLAVGADWTPSAGDVVIRKDVAGTPTTANLSGIASVVARVIGGMSVWEIPFTSGEMTTDFATVTIYDQSAANNLELTAVNICTYNNASAGIPSGDTAGTTTLLTRIPAFIEGAYTLTHSMRLILAAVAAKSSGATVGIGGTIHVRDFSDTKDRLVVVVDANGNETSISSVDAT